MLATKELVYPNAGRAAKREEIHRDESSWSGVQRNPMPATCTEYLDSFPEGRHRAEALDLLDDLAWRRAAEENTFAGYCDYSAAFPVGRHADELRVALDGIEGGVARGILVAPDAATCERYLSAYPSGGHRGDVLKALDELLFAAAESAGTPAAYRHYAKTLPFGRHVDKAWRAVIPDMLRKDRPGAVDMLDDRHDHESRWYDPQESHGDARLPIIAALAVASDTEQSALVLDEFLRTPQILYTPITIGPTITTTMYTYQTGPGASPYNGPSGSITTVSRPPAPEPPSYGCPAREAAAQALWRVSPHAALKLMVAALDKKSHSDYSRYLFGIVQSGARKEHSHLTSVFLRQLGSGDSLTRGAAALTLGMALESGTELPEFAEVTTALLRALHNPNESFRGIVGDALELITEQSFGTDVDKWEAWWRSRSSGGKR